MISVIGVGFPRTGTMSLKLALEQLGFGPCYHMIEVFNRPQDVPIWREALAGNADWERLLAGFGSSADAPGCVFWRELTALFPEAKCVLTVRDSDSWYESFLHTAYEAITHPERSPSDEHRAVQGMARELLLERLFEGRFEDRQRAIEIYETHNRTVQESISSDRLLVFEVKEGWEPLCGFLGRDVPPEPFPHINTRQEFRERFHVDPAWK
jgi:hypothetical protein